MEPPKPLLLSTQEQARIHGWVQQYLPPTYDREFIADTIILNAWLKEIPHVSREYVRNKCISAWRTLNRERTRNEMAALEGRVRTDRSMASSAPLEKNEQDISERKMLINEATQAVLSPFERRLIWMRYYDSQSLEEISGRVKLRRDQVQSAIQVALYKMRIHLT